MDEKLTDRRFNFFFACKIGPLICDGRNRKFEEIYKNLVKEWSIISESTKSQYEIESDYKDDIPSSSDPSMSKSVKKEVKFSPECESCEKTFVSKSALALHFTAVHLNQKPFECDKCKKAFSYKGGLKRHGCS